MAKDNSCLNCKNYDQDSFGNCKAYPDGIPFEIISGELSHLVNQPNDSGIKFEPIEDEDDR